MEFFTIFISLAALLISLLSYLRERRLITVDFSPNCFALDVNKNIIVADNIFKDAPHQYAIFTTAIIVNASIINSSYFDLRAYNPKTNENHFVCTLTSLPLLKNNPRLLISPFHPSTLGSFVIDLPNARYGSISSGDCLELFLIKIFLLKKVFLLNLKFHNMHGFHGNDHQCQHLIEKNLNTIVSITT